MCVCVCVCVPGSGSGQVSQPPRTRPNTYRNRAPGVDKISNTPNAAEHLQEPGSGSGQSLKHPERGRTPTGTGLREWTRSQTPRTRPNQTSPAAPLPRPSASLARPLRGFATNTRHGQPGLRSNAALPSRAVDCC